MTIQFKKGVLELCVLSMLRQEDQYGYDVAMKLAQNIDVADGSIYLVLRRLKQDGYVSSYLEESSGGPPRKYYVITREGTEFLDRLTEEWSVLVSNVNAIIEGHSAAEKDGQMSTSLCDISAAQTNELLLPTVTAETFITEGGIADE